MSEEKEEKKEETKQEGKPAEPAKVKSESAPKTEAKESKSKEVEAGGAQKGRKVTRMTLDEVEKELKSVQEKMGGFQSRFARHLLARKKELSKT